MLNDKLLEGYLACRRYSFFTNIVYFRMKQGYVITKYENHFLIPIALGGRSMVHYNKYRFYKVE
jgi:hypothetical protein